MYGFDESACLTSPGPVDDAVEVTADHRRDSLHGPDLGAHDVGAPLEHGANDMALLAKADIAQWFSIKPSTGGARCREAGTAMIEVIGSTLSTERSSALPSEATAPTGTLRAERTAPRRRRLSRG